MGLIIKDEMYIGRLPGRRRNVVARKYGSEIKVLAYFMSDGDMEQFTKLLYRMMGWT